jgi:subtilisin family serine protease
MSDLIVSIRRDALSDVLTILHQKGAPYWKYAESLSDRLKGFNSSTAVSDLPYTFHRVTVEDGLEAAASVRIRLLCDPDRTGRVEVDVNDALGYQALGLPFVIGGKHQDYLDRMNVPEAHNAGVEGKDVKIAIVDSGQDGTQRYGDVKGYHHVQTPSQQQPNPPILHETNPPITPYDTDGHGSAMSSLVRSVARAAHIYIVRISDTGAPTVWNLLAVVGIAAYDCQAEIINLSLGYSKIATCRTCGGTAVAQAFALEKFLEGITKGRFIIYVAAAGNERNVPGGFNQPTAYKHAVAVRVGERQ